MRYLGIDYGTKRVGVSLSDESGMLAFPYTVLKNDATLLDEVMRIAKEQKVRSVILGESTDNKGKPNKVAAAADVFKKSLEKALRKPVIYEPEFLTSVQAARFQGKVEKLDASAAAIILQSYLDRKTN